MSIVPVSSIFSLESRYVRLVLTKLKKENRFHIEEDEEVIDIQDFFEALFNLTDKERERRQGNGKSK